MKTPEQAWGTIAETFRNRHPNATRADMGKRPLPISPITCANGIIFGKDEIRVFPLQMDPIKDIQYTAALDIQHLPTGSETPDELVKFIQVNHKPNAPSLESWAKHSFTTFCHRVCTEPTCPHVRHTRSQKNNGAKEPK